MRTDILIGSGICDQRCFRIVSLPNMHLPVPLVRIWSRKDLRLKKGIDGVTHGGKRVIVLQRRPIQFSIVDAEAQLAVIFGNKENNGDPVGFGRLDNTTFVLFSSLNAPSW